MSLKKPFYVFGDFNINLLNKSPGTKKIQSFLSTFGISQTVSEYTREETILNLFIPNVDNVQTTVVPSSVSDPELVIGEIPYKKSPVRFRSILVKGRDDSIAL